MKTKSIFILIIILMFFVPYSKSKQPAFYLHNKKVDANIAAENFMSSITLTSPNGGESITAGTAYQITWTSDAIENVKIDYSTNNGANWITIINSTPAVTGSYSWLVPNTPSENCKVLVSDVSNALINDQSNNVFTIIPYPPPVIAFSVDMSFISPPITDNDIIAVRGKFSPLSWFQNYELQLTNNKVYERTINFEPSLIDSILEYKFIIERSGSGIQWEQNVGPGDGGNRVYVIQPGEIELPTVYFDSTSRFIDFETLGQNFEWTIFGNGPGGIETDFAVALNPDIEGVNSSRHCGKYIVRADAEPWSGVTTENIEPFVLSIYNSTIKVMVYKDVISNFNLKLEGPELNEDYNVSNTITNQWEILTFDYSSHIGKTVNKLTIIPDLVTVRNSGSINYFDNISFGPQPSITLTSPNGGEIWSANSVGTISWVSESIENVKIDYSTNNGANWMNVVQSIPADNGSYDWILPNTPSTNCKVLISDASNALLKDESDAVFTISPAVMPSIQLSSPNGGENWAVGSEQNITWISNDIENIKIDYTTNSGTNWINIVQSVPASGGSFIWTLPNTPSEDCTVLISDVNNALLNDQSDDKFTISTQITPEIIVTSPNGGEQWQGGTLKNITWSSTAVTNVKIDYSTNNGTNWVNIVASLSASSGTYAWTVPNTPSSNCKVLISDVNNALINDQSNNLFSLFNYNTSLTINTSFNFGDVTKTSSYKSIGLPGNISIPLATIMTGNPGKENDWRAFWDNGTSPLIEYNGSNTFTFEPGKAFFVISKNQIVINQNVSTVQLAADNTYSIPLHNEWNLISNPFDKTISWSSVQNANSVTQPIHLFQNGSYNSPANFEPYNGYYFFNSAGLTALKIPYNTPGNLEKNNSPDKKELEIRIGSDNENKSQVTIGFSELAETGVDPLDIFSPPSQFCEINISIYNKEIETSYKHLQKEYRKEINDGQEFNVLVENNSDRNVIMFFSGLENFIDYETYLLDINQSKSYDLKKTDNIEIENNMKLKSFQLLIGTKEYISQKQTNLIPDEYLLYQNYPNPFNPSTVISYQLPVSGNVSLKVYDILGRKIITLVDEYKNAGRYEIEFHPVSGIQHPASGIYFYQLRAGSFVEAKKMILLR